MRMIHNVNLSTKNASKKCYLLKFDILQIANQEDPLDQDQLLDLHPSSDKKLNKVCIIQGYKIFYS